jgi:hypothetical protein
VKYVTSTLEIFSWTTNFTKNTGAYVRTQNWHKADQVDATGQTGVPGQSDRSGSEAVVATSAPVKSVGPESK